MMHRPRATSLRISSGSSFSRFAMYSISSVMTPCRAKCICDILRFPFAAAAFASLVSIQLSRSAMAPPQRPRRRVSKKGSFFFPLAGAVSLDYGTGGRVSQHSRGQIRGHRVDRPGSPGCSNWSLKMTKHGTEVPCSVDFYPVQLPGRELTLLQGQAAVRAAGAGGVKADHTRLVGAEHALTGGAN